MSWWEWYLVIGTFTSIAVFLLPTREVDKKYDWNVVALGYVVVGLIWPSLLNKVDYTLERRAQLFRYTNALESLKTSFEVAQEAHRDLTGEENPNLLKAALLASTELGRVPRREE